MQRCQDLKEYSYFVSVVRTYLEKGLELNDAIVKAVKICINENVMKEFLEKNASEVVNMLFTEFDMDTAKEIWKEEGKKEGRKEGIEEAQKELTITRRIAKMAKQYSAEEIQEDIMQLFGISRDQAEEEYRKVFGD